MNVTAAAVDELDDTSSYENISVVARTFRVSTLASILAECGPSCAGAHDASRCRAQIRHPPNTCSVAELRLSYSDPASVPLVPHLDFSVLCPQASSKMSGRQQRVMVQPIVSIHFVHCSSADGLRLPRMSSSRTFSRCVTIHDPLQSRLTPFPADQSCDLAIRQYRDAYRRQDHCAYPQRTRSTRLALKTGAKHIG